MTELTIVCFKWKPRMGYAAFPADSVNVLRRMVARHYHRPHRFICVTDDPVGINNGIETVPLWNDYASVPSPHGHEYPSCYRRLRMFDPSMTLGGPRYLCLDLDTVIVADVTEQWDRTEDFVGWQDPIWPRQVNGSMMLFTPDRCRLLWDAFDASISPELARAAGYYGSDQAWVSYCLGKGMLSAAHYGTWTRAHGVLSYRLDCQRGLPANAKIVFFHGKTNPWSKTAQALPWVKDNWK